MRKKMLLVAVGDYQGLAQTLVAPVQELDRFEKLMSSPPFGFTSIRTPLRDRMATRQNIMDGIEQLLSNAQPDDQLLFMFFGHGSNVPVRGSVGNGDREQVVIGYPNGDSNLRKASVRYSDVRALFERIRPDERADITFFIDACFSRGAAPDGAISLFVPLDEGGGIQSQRGMMRMRDIRSQANVLAFSDLADVGQSTSAARVLDSSQARRTRARVMSSYVAGDDAGGGNGSAMGQVVVISACRKDEAAYQIQLEADGYRLLFSMRALQQLRQSHDTCEQLIANINPLRNGFPQHAVAHGSPERLAETFPGQLGTTLAPGDVHEDPSLQSASSIHMRVLGLGCFIERGADLNRIVLPYDDYGIGDKKHFGFIEVSEEDLYPTAGSYTGTLVPSSYTRGGVRYLRWTLSEHRVWLYNEDNSEGFVRSDDFQQHVPNMTQVCPELTAPREECNDLFPDPEWFSGFIDLGGGSVDIGQLEDVPTRFTRKYGQTPTPWGPEKTPRSVIAHLNFTGSHAILLVADIGGFSTAEIFIRPGATILAGNAREKDITGIGEGETPREHFEIFYKLSDTIITNPALPAVAQAPLNACSVTRFP